MKEFTELLMYVIAQETKSIETMRHSLKEDELTILRLQNKTRAIIREIEDRKRLIEEYRSFLKSISDTDKARIKLISPSMRYIGADQSVTINQAVKYIEKQA